MKTKKTRWDKRGTYTFQFNDGTSITLRPGEDGVTEADIKILHSLDDAEVYNNIKNSRPPMTAEEKSQEESMGGGASRRAISGELEPVLRLHGRRRWRWRQAGQEPHPLRDMHLHGNGG